MAIQGVIYQNQKVSAEDHAALFQMFISDGILSGCGMSRLRNVLTISSGMFVLAGRLSKIIGSEQITIPDSIRPAAGSTANVRLTGVIDLNQTASKTEFHQFSFRLDAASGGTYPALRKENINTGNGKYYEVEWAILTIDGDGNITNVEKKIGDSEGTTPSGGGGSESDFHFDTENGMLYDKQGSDWEVAFLLNGTLVLDKALNNVDVFMVNAGRNGGNGADGDSAGGVGGNGGKYQIWTGTSIPAGTYAVVVGQSDGATTSFGELMAVSSDAASIPGGDRALGGPYETNHEAGIGTNGVYAFGDSANLIYPARKYGSSGGGGGTYSASNGANYPGKLGGENAGAGSSNINTNGGAGLANSGAGGGGGFGYYSGRGSHTSGGNGGSGIILIRPARTAS